MMGDYGPGPEGERALVAALLSAMCGALAWSASGSWLLVGAVGFIAFAVMMRTFGK